jgi:hypothetical protein
MAINKNFVIKNGAEINTKLLVANADNQTIGIGTTTAGYTLHVFGPGGIGATFVNVTGITTTQALNVLGVSTFSAGPILLARGELTGTASQGLQVGTATTVSGAYISGDVGIGVTLAGAKLNVVPTASGIAGLFSGTTSNDMVRITQLGAGNALVVEDSSNPDVTSFVISGFGSVGIGTSFPRYLLDIDTTTSTGTTAVYIRGDVKITGDLSADDLIFDQGTFTTLNVTGFTTLGGTSATLLNVSGITTVAGGFNATQGADFARLRVTGITTLGQANITGLSNAGVSTLGNATASTLVVSGFSTFSSISAGNVILAGITTGLNVPGISTFGDITASDISLAGITTGLNASGISTLVSLTGTSANFSGISTLAFVQSTTSNVTGFSTLGSVSAGNVILAGITTGLNAPGISTLVSVTGTSANFSGINTLSSLTGTNVNYTGVGTIANAQSTTLNVTGFSTLGSISAGNVILAGITTGLTAPGISTLTSVSGTNINYTGVGTIANVQSTNLNVTGVATVNDFNATGSFNVFSPNAIFSNDVTINGNLSIGGTSTIINAASLRIEDKDIVLGFTTSQLPTDDTANHGGVAVASTEGTPLVSLQVVGINTFPDTYKQIMWVKRNTMGAGTTDAWLFNYGVGIGSTQVPTGVRLAVGAVQITDDAVNARIGNLTNVRATNINATGITTTNSLSIDATQVISSARELQNIASLDATTTATIEAAISNAPNTFTDIRVSGLSTFVGLATFNNGVYVSGIATFQNDVKLADNASLYFGDGNDLRIFHNGANSFITEVGTGHLFIDSSNTYYRSLKHLIQNSSSSETLAVFTADGSVELYYDNSKKLETSGIGVTVTGTLNTTQLSVTGIATLGVASVSLLSVTGISTIGNVLVTPGAHGIGATVGSNVGVVTYYGDGANLTGVSIGIQSAGNVIGYGVTTLNFIGIGNTFAYNPVTKTVDVSIRGGGGSSGFATYIAGIATASSVGVNTSNLDDPDLTGIGNSFKGLYVGNGMIIVDNQLNGDHYIGTNFNGLMAGPVTINGTLTVDGNYVVV